MSSVILARWSEAITTTQECMVYPDGCRDLIWSSQPGGPAQWRYTSLDTAPRRVKLQKDTQLHGFRLAPGAYVEPALLLQLRVDDLQTAAAQIEQSCRVAPDVAEILDALRDGLPPREALSHLTISNRSVQRILADATTQGPLFWARLARARLAAQRATDGCALAVCAAESGFSDQAHMTREFRRWFGITPAALQRNQHAATAVAATGFGAERSTAR